MHADPYSAECSSSTSLNLNNTFDVDIDIVASFLYDEHLLERMITAKFDLDTDADTAQQNGYISENASDQTELSDTNMMSKPDEVFSTSEEEDEHVLNSTGNIANQHVPPDQEQSVRNKTAAENNKKRKYNEKPLTRKRLRCPEKWERNITKAAENLGISGCHIFQ